MVVSVTKMAPVNGFKFIKKVHLKWRKISSKNKVVILDISPKLNDWGGCVIIYHFSKKKNETGKIWKTSFQFESQTKIFFYGKKH